MVMKIKKQIKEIACPKLETREGIICNKQIHHWTFSAQKMKFSIKDFFS